jgi:hypothetical protein
MQTGLALTYPQDSEGVKQAFGWKGPCGQTPLHSTPLTLLESLSRRVIANQKRRGQSLPPLPLTDHIRNSCGETPRPSTKDRVASIIGGAV